MNEHYRGVNSFYEDKIDFYDFKFNRREIEDISAVGNKFFGIINCLLIFNLPTGIKMLQGKKRVLLKKRYQEERIVFWLYPNEVSKLRSNV